GRDELGRLTDGFNRMVETLHATTVSKDYADGIIRSMGDSLVVASTAGEILTVNNATTDLLGYSEADLVGRPIETLFADDDEDDDLAAGAPTRDDGSVERLYRARDGRRIPISILASVLKLDHQESGLVLVAKDITERRRAEEALRRSEHKLSLHIQ